MTHGILQSDIDLARQMLKAGQPEQEIVGALARRGIEPRQVVQLISDLRQGKQIAPDIAVIRSSAPRTRRDPARQREHSEHRPRPATSSERQKSARRAWTVVFVLLAVVAVGGGMWVWHKRAQRLQEDAPESRTNFVTSVEPGGPSANQSLADPPASAAAVNNAITDGIKQPPTNVLSGASGPGEDMPETQSRPKLALTVQDDGLHCSTVLLTHGNALETLQRALGPPTRTHQVNSKTTVYTYDRDGVMLYAVDDAKGDCLAIDFDGAGGEAGTEKPFTGQLKLAGNEIGQGTDTNRVAALISVQMSRPSAGVMRGEYGRSVVDFVFSERNDRLSLVQITLK